MRQRLVDCVCVLGGDARVTHCGIVLEARGLVLTSLSGALSNCSDESCHFGPSWWGRNGWAQRAIATQRVSVGSDGIHPSGLLCNTIVTPDVPRSWEMPSADPHDA